jgi:hypothetical protein
MQQRSARWAILVGGSIAGTLDILYAITYWSFNGLSAELQATGFIAGPDVAHVLRRRAYRPGMRKGRAG